MNAIHVISHCLKLNLFLSLSLSLSLQAFVGLFKMDQLNDFVFPLTGIIHLISVFCSLEYFHAVSEDASKRNEYIYPV